MWAAEVGFYFNQVFRMNKKVKGDFEGYNNIFTLHETKEAKEDGCKKKAKRNLN